MCVEIYTKGSPLSSGVVYLWYILILLLPPVKEIFHFKWRLIGDVVGFFIVPAAGYGSLTHLFVCVRVFFFETTVSKMSLFFNMGQYCLALQNFPQVEAY